METFLTLIAKKEVYGLLIIVAVSIIAYKLFIKIIEKIINRTKNAFEKKKRTTVFRLFRNIVKYAIYALAIIFVLDLYGVNVTSLVASLGVLSAVSALALQDTIKDVISGSSIIMDNYYVVGDYVKYGDFLGIVTELGLRTTKIMNFNGEVLTIANRNINEITNLSQKQASVLIEVPTAYEEKCEKVDKVFKEIIEEIKTWPTMDEEKTYYLGIEKFSDSSIVYAMRFYCSPAKKWEYEREILRLVKIKYEEHKIKIPYNQVEVHNGK